MFITQKLEAVKKNLRKLNETATAEEKAFYESLLDVVTDIAAQTDIVAVDVKELQDNTEAYKSEVEVLSAAVQTVRDNIVGEISVDTSDYNYDVDDDIEEESFDSENFDYKSSEGGCGGNCENCSGCGAPVDEAYEDFITVQCPFCSEIFFIERSEYEDNVECPLCNHNVSVLDNIVGEE